MTDGTAPRLLKKPDGMPNDGSSPYRETSFVSLVATFRQKMLVCSGGMICLTTRLVAWLWKMMYWPFSLVPRMSIGAFTPVLGSTPVIGGGSRDSSVDGTVRSSSRSSHGRNRTGGWV